MAIASLVSVPVPDPEPVRREVLVFGQPFVDEATIDDVVEVLRSGWLGRGPRTERFEQEFRECVGARFACALNSGSAGLFLALEAAGIGPGDEVVTTPLTFAATLHAVEHVGATVVLADVDPATLNLDPERVERALTPQTRAILPVHFAGLPCDMDELHALARDRGIVVIEDAAHAIGASYRGSPVGSLSDMTVFSFQASKNVTTGEGGIVTTDNEAWADRIRLMSIHGMSNDAWRAFRSASPPPAALAAGYKFSMTDVQAAIGSCQLERLAETRARRDEIWARYDRELAGLPLSAPPGNRDDVVHARHLYTVLVDVDRVRMSRDEVRSRLRWHGVGTGVHYVAAHLHPYYEGRPGFGAGSFPHAEWIGERTLSLPLSAHLSDADVADVVDAMHNVLAPA